MECPQVPGEIAPVTDVADVPSVQLRYCGEGSHHVTFVWVAESTVMRNCKCLVMNDCECKNLNSTAMEYLKWYQDV